MTSKDYIAIAAAFRAAREASVATVHSRSNTGINIDSALAGVFSHNTEVAQRIADVFGKDNALFDRQEFLHAALVS